MFKERTSVLDYFRKAPDPKELVRKWQASLRMEVRHTERHIRDIERERKNTEKLVREAAKRGDMASAKILAKEIVHTKKAISQLYVNKAQMISIQTALTEQLAMVKVSGTLGKSAELMKVVNSLIKVPELAAAMRDMSQEMMKAGIIDEMMEDMLDSAVDTEDLEDETEEEVDKILLELAGETMSQLATAPKVKAPSRVQIQQPQEEVAEEEDDIGELQDRLNAIRS